MTCLDKMYDVLTKDPLAMRKEFITILKDFVILLEEPGKGTDQITLLKRARQFIKHHDHENSPHDQQGPSDDEVRCPDCKNIFNAIPQAVRNEIKNLRLEVGQFRKENLDIDDELRKSEVKVEQFKNTVQIVNSVIEQREKDITWFKEVVHGLATKKD